jgi:chromosome segregation ATPase
MSHDAMPISETLQFKSFRTIVHDRISRREWRSLCRSGFSEEQNIVEGEKKMMLKRRKSELGLLRSTLESKDEEICRLKEAAKSVTPTTMEKSKIKELEAELDTLRKDLDRPHEPATPMMNQDFEEDVMGLDDIDESFLNGEFDANMTGMQSHNSSHLETPPETPRRPRYMTPATASIGTQSRIPDPQQVVLQESVKSLKKKLHDISGSLEETAQSHHRLLTKLRPFLAKAEARTPSDAPLTLDEALDTVLTAVVLAESKSEDAEAALDALRSEVSDLGFEGETAGDVLQNLKILFRDARLELEYLAPGENSEGFENDKLLHMLLQRAKRLQQDIEHRDELLDTQRRRDAVLYEQINVKNKIVGDLKGRVFELESEADERERSMGKLQHALDGYRNEIQGLERFVERLEMDHNLALAGKESDADEAVADLDSRLTAEIKSREEAESEANIREKAIEALRQKLQNATRYAEAARDELKTMLAGKQAEIESLTLELKRREYQHGANLAARDERILSLRKQSDDLSDKLTEARNSIMGLTAAKAALENKLVEERETSAQVLKEKHIRWMGEVDALKRNMANDYLRCHQIAHQSADGSSSSSEEGDDFVRPRLGFVTSSIQDAVSKNVKSKRRWDSGIGVVEEDDDEAMDGGVVA